jgi:hypothetical protein
LAQPTEPTEPTANMEGETPCLGSKKLEVVAAPKTSQKIYAKTTQIN